MHVRKRPDRENLQLYYVDPLTGKDITKSSKTMSIGDAERMAGDWEKQLRDGQTEDISWDAFRIRFVDEYLTSLSKSTQETTKGALNSFEELIGHPKRLSDVNASVLSKFAAALRKKKRPETTIHCRLGHLRVAIRWAARIGLIQRVPFFPMPKLSQRRLMRGRAITTGE